MRTYEKGAEAEAIVCADLIRAGHEVFLPFAGYSAADLISVKGASRPIRWQVKCRKASVKTPALSLALRGNSPGRTMDLTLIDAFAIYSPDTKEVYYVPLSAIPEGASTFNLNFSPSKRVRPGVRSAFDFRDPNKCLGTILDTLA